MNSVKYWLSIPFEWIMRGSYKVMHHLRNEDHDWYLITIDELDIIIEDCKDLY